MKRRAEYECKEGVILCGTGGTCRISVFGGSDRNRRGAGENGEDSDSDGDSRRLGTSNNISKDRWGIYNRKLYL